MNMMILSIETDGKNIFCKGKTFGNVTLLYN